MSNGPIYTLGEQLYSADGIVTYRGFVASTNEAVYIHALPVESVELYDQALRLFRSYSVERPILNLFAFEGQPYVITRPGPEQANFRSWLSAQTAMQDKKSSSPPIVFNNGREHSTPRGFEVPASRTVTANPSLGLVRESRNLSTPSTPNKTSPGQGGEFTRTFGPLNEAKHKGPTPGPSAAKISCPVPLSDPGLETPSRGTEDPFLKTMRSGSKERPDVGGSSGSAVLRPHDRNGTWARSDLGPGQGETELPVPSKPFSTTPGDRDSELPGSGMSEFTRVFGTKAFDQPSLAPSEIPGTTDVPPSDFTRLIRSKNPVDRKAISEPQRPETKREELHASGPAYGPATRVFQSPRKDGAEPASPGLTGGEFTRVYGPKDTAPQFGDDRPDTNGEGGQKTNAEPVVQKSSAASASPNAGPRIVENKDRPSRLPLILVLIFSLLIVIGVIAYLALWAK